MLERQKHPLGDIMRMTEENAVLATYYRNNILHLFAMPSLIACCFIGNARMSTRGSAAPGVARVSVHRRGTVPALGGIGGRRASSMRCSTLSPD